MKKMKTMVKKKKKRKKKKEVKKKNRMFEEFPASTVMTHHSKAVCFISLSSGVGGIGGSVFYFGPHNKSYKKYRTPLSSLHFVAIKGSFHKTHLLAVCKRVFRGVYVRICVWGGCNVHTALV